MKKYTEQQKINLFLDWANNFLSTSAFMEYYDLSMSECENLIDEGRELNRELNKKVSSRHILQTKKSEKMNRIEQAKKTLRDEGYFTDTMWTISDVQSIYDCNAEESHQLLEKVFDSDWIMSRINEMIDENAELMGFQDKHQLAIDMMEELDERYGRNARMSLDEYHLVYKEENSAYENEEMVELINKF
tara:strand:- start:6376 stop:6942 length:567 start_codon:yes stop_codon:yes gene_type:complete